MNSKALAALHCRPLPRHCQRVRGGDHSEQGTGDARTFCEQHGPSAGDTELVVWLVRAHLTMSNVAQKQDISDPDVVKAFADIVGNERSRLTALYLLTVADIRGTSPKVWNSWKGQLLQDLYSATRKQLLEGGQAPAAQGRHPGAASRGDAPATLLCPFRHRP